MTDVTTINTGTYWDGRFSTDWESFEGPRQSRFFARLAIENLPHWLFDEIRRDHLSLVDWGCAQGDGTDVLASYIDAGQLSGVDFSAVAIEQASQRYPAIEFLNEDWLAAAQAGHKKFDVVFSSNTLEHFHQPYDVLRILGQRASKAIVLALPYRERDRIDEHFYSFLPENLPLVLENGFRLAWSRVIDCRPLPNTLWGGEQVILVYAAPAWLDQRRMCLQDSRIEHDDQSVQSRHLQEQSRKLEEQSYHMQEQSRRQEELSRRQEEQS